MAHDAPAAVRDPPSDPGVILKGAIQILGAFAGFGALVYGVGFAIEWLRYATTGFNADEAMVAVDRSRLIALGFRWVVGWGVAVIFLMCLAHIVATIAGTLRPAGKRQSPKLWFSIKVLLAGLIVGAALLTWSALTIAIDLAAVAFFMRWYLRAPTEAAGEPASPGGPTDVAGEPSPSIGEPSHQSAPTYVGRRGSLSRLVIFVALLSALSAIGWQLEINLPYDHATFNVKGEQLDGIYFGQSEGDVFVAVRPAHSNVFLRAISIFPASELSQLQIRPQVQTLCTRVDRPSVTAGHEVSKLWDLIQQHLSRTGQPASTAAPAPEKNLPKGHCPALP
jgi:hypothetical protein